MIEKTAQKFGHTSSGQGSLIFPSEAVSIPTPVPTPTPPEHPVSIAPTQQELAFVGCAIDLLLLARAPGAATKIKVVEKAVGLTTGCEELIPAAPNSLLDKVRKAVESNDLLASPLERALLGFHGAECVKSFTELRKGLKKPANFTEAVKGVLSDCSDAGKTLKKQLDEGDFGIALPLG